MRALTYSDVKHVLKGFCDVQSRQIRRPEVAGYDALVVGAPCAGARGRWLHLWAEGSRLRHQRSRGIRGGRQDPAAQCGLVCEQAEAHASDRGCDLGRGISQARNDAAEKRLRRTASRRMAGHESRGVPGQPSAPAVTGSPRSTSPRPAARVSWTSITACCGAIERITREHAGQDVIAVAHGGTIKAAVGLALGGLLEKGLAFDIDNCSVTRLDHIASAGHAVGGCRWSTSSHGSRMPRTPRCISRRGRRVAEAAEPSSLDPERRSCRIPQTLLSSRLKNQNRRIRAGSTSGRET